MLRFGALAGLLLGIAVWPAAARAQVECSGPVSGPTGHCPDCIYDAYGAPEDTAPAFACAQFADTRPLGGNPNSDQYADPFLVEGDATLESTTIRIRKLGIVPGDAVVRVWDDDDVLGNDDPEDPASFDDNRPGTVLAHAVISESSMLCEGITIHQGSKCDVSADFDATPLLEDGVVYWVGAAMVDAAFTSVSWVQAEGESQQQPVCMGPTCSEEWVFASTNSETPAWMAATNVDPVGLVRLVPEAPATLMRLAALGTLPGLAALARRRRARAPSAG